MLVIRRSLAGRELYFDESLSSCEDWDLALRLSTIVNIGLVAEPLVNVDRTAKVDWVAAGISYLAILNKYLSQISARPKVLACHHEQIAHCYCGTDVKRAQHHFELAIRAYPWQLTSYCFYVSCFFGRSGIKASLRLRRAILKLRRFLRTVVRHKSMRRS